VRALVLPIILYLMVSASLQAPGSPSDAAHRVFAALQRKDWRALVSLIDSTSLQTVREEELRAFVAWGRQKDEIAAANRANRGWSLDIHNDLPAAEIAAVKDVRVPTLEGSPTIGTLAAESPADFFVRLCRAGYETPTRDSPLKHFTALQRQIVGEVLDGDSLAYVLYRREARWIQDDTQFIGLPGRLMIATMRRHDGAWRMVLDDDIGWSPDLGVLLPGRPEWPGPIPEFKTQTRTMPLPAAPTGALPPRRAASEVARAALAAFETGDWKGLAALVHPDQLEDFQQRQIIRLIQWEDSRSMRERAFREGSTAFVMSYSDSLTADDLARAANIKLPLFGDSVTIGQLAHLSPAAFFERWCAVMFGEASHFYSMREAKRRVIGEVRETDGLTQVVYRSRARYAPQRLAVVRTQDDWGIYLNDELAPEGGIHLLLDPHDSK
jgi:hypothetical protein